MWRTMWLTLLCLASAPAWCAGKECSLDANTMFTFTWVPQTANDTHEGSVRITNHAGQTVQVLDNQTYYYGDDVAFNESIDTSDFNNDGCGDLVFTSDIASIGNIIYSAFLYDPARKRFVNNEPLSGIMGLEIDQRDKGCVTGYGKGGADYFSSERHCWSKGELVLKEENSVYPVYNKKGALTCYVHATTTYLHGKKKTKTNCTKTL